MRATFKQTVAAAWRGLAVILSSPTRTAIAGGACFAVIYVVFMALELRSTKAPCAPMVPDASGIAEKIELACAAVMLGCLLNHATIFLNFATVKQLNREALITTTIAFCVSFVTYCTLSANATFNCTVATYAGLSQEYFPIRLVSSGCSMPALVGAVTHFQKETRGAVAAQTASIFTLFAFVAVLQYGAEYFGVWIVSIIGLFITCIGALYVTARGIWSSKIPRTTSGIFVRIVGLLFIILQTILVAYGAVMGGATPIDEYTRRIMWAIFDTLCRVSLSLTFLSSDLRRTASTLQVELDEVEKRRAVAEAANEAQKLFTRWLFHELRVPMQSMVLSIDELQETLREGEAAASPGGTKSARTSLQQQLQRDCADAAQAGAAQVCRLLDSVLSLAKIEAGKTQVEVVPFSVHHDLVRSTAAMFRAVVDKRGLRLALNVEPSIAASVLGDAPKLKMALANFISNAIKFSRPGGTVTVTVSGVKTAASLLLNSIAEPRVLDESVSDPHDAIGALPPASTPASVTLSVGTSIAEDLPPGPRQAAPFWKRLLRGGRPAPPAILPRAQSSPPGSPAPLPASPTLPLPLPSETVPCLRLSVTDSGIGISAPDMRNLFRPFVQVRSTHVSAEQGSGLGLSICRRMIELCGGRVGVASQVGRGSTFWLEVPVPPECVTAPGAPSAARAAAGAGTGAFLLPTHEAPGDAPVDCATIAIAASRAAESYATTQSLSESDRTASFRVASLSVAVPSTGEHVWGGGLARPLTSPFSVHATPASASPKHSAFYAPSPRLRPLLWAAVVDDVASNLAMFTRLLTRRGVRVLLTAENGADGLAKLELLTPHQRQLLRVGPAAAWFIDKTMPVMDGLELTRRLRAGGEPVTVPIFAVTADALQEDQAAYIAIGATAVIPKPCTQQVVAAALEATTLRWPTEAECNAAAPPPSP